MAPWCCAGVLLARAPLDYEAAREHELLVRATDGVTGAFADAAVTLRVLDVNDCAPEFPQDVYRALVSEAASVGDLVLLVHAVDNDTGELPLSFEYRYRNNHRVDVSTLRSSRVRSGLTLTSRRQHNGTFLSIALPK